MSNIWKKLSESKKPFFVLAPMDDVTDTAFRQLVAETAEPDLFYTEFANVDGLQSAGRDNVMQKLKYTKNEIPLIAQIWGLNPDNYYKTAKEIADMGFDGIDLNMGCPVPVVTKKGCCSALIKTPGLAAELISATKEGAGELPVSVKTRIGFNQIQTEEWCGFLLEQSIDALIVHGRTTKEQSKVPCHWDEIGKVAKIKSKMAFETPIVGNGDVLSLKQGRELAEHYQLDGVMIGRGIFKNPWVFREGYEGTKAERLELFKKHIGLFEEAWGAGKNPATLKKFAKMYVNGFDGASDLRSEIMKRSSLSEMWDLLDNLN